MTGEGLVKRQMRGAVLVLWLACPPVNALSADLMADLTRALRAADSEPAVLAVVLAAEGPQFSVGFALAAADHIERAALPDLTALIENLSKPVVAAMQGRVLGGAMEIALACHGRIAHEGARLGLPDISLGLLPVAGSTQRLPRLVGAATALNMLLDGRALSAVQALATGLVDGVVDTPPVERAVTLAADLARHPPRKTADRGEGMRDPLTYQASILDARKRLAGWRLPAPLAMVDCVEAALLLPFDSGLGFEASHAQTLAETPEALGLRHALLAERRALQPPADLVALGPVTLSSITVLGTGGPAAEIVRMALAAGFRLHLVGFDRIALTDAVQRIAAGQAAQVAEGTLTQEACDADWSRLVGVLGADDLPAADLVLAMPDAPELADRVRLGPVVSLGGAGGGAGPLVLYPAAMPAGLAHLAISAGVPLAQQAAALAFGRALGWRVMVQGPGGAIDQRLRAALSRAIAVLETEGLVRPEAPPEVPAEKLDRAYIAAVLASYGLGAGSRPKLPPAPDGAAAVLDFCLAALMNEAARIVSDGAVRNPADVDASALLSGLFPRWQGGPIHQADRKGLMALRADLRQRAARHPRLFTPAPVIERLIGTGATFATMTR